MFSGIIENTGLVLAAQQTSDLVRIQVQRPPSFDDLKLGDSIACDGVCLTLEKDQEGQMQFALGLETLKITRWDLSKLEGRILNLERSLRFNDRIHGHLVSGHVDGIGHIQEAHSSSEGLFLKIEVPADLKKYFWPKGSIAINGVSLTLNGVNDQFVDVYLIPETLKRTNLKNLKTGDVVNLEVDWMARGLIHAVKERL